MSAEKLAEFESHGFQCLVVNCRGSHLCGYVGIPEGHPWYRTDYDGVRVDGDYVDVHGGLTFADDHVLAGEKPAGVWWIGFDCAHSGDRIGGPNGDDVSSALRRGRSGVWRDEAFVRGECEKLAKQAALVVRQ